MVFEARHNGVLVARHEDADHLKTHVVGHLGDDVEISEGRGFELHAVGEGKDAIIDSFHDLDEAREKWTFYTSPQLWEDGSVRREARFPKAEIRNAGGTVVWPVAVTAEAVEAEAPSASEATTDPAPADGELAAGGEPEAIALNGPLP